MRNRRDRRLLSLSRIAAAFALLAVGLGVWSMAPAQEAEGWLELELSAQATLVLTWPEVDGAASHVVYVRKQGQWTWERAVLGASARRYELLSLEPGTHYIVRVRSLDARGRRLAEWRKAIKFELPGPRWQVPTQTTASAATVRWTAPDGWTPTGYRLRWRPSGALEFLGPVDLDADARSYTLSELDADQEYELKLTAVRADGRESLPDTVQAVRLAALTALELLAETAASGSVKLSWVSDQTNVTAWEYRYRQGDGEWGAWIRISESNASTTSHTVSGLTEDARYDFQLRGVNAVGPDLASATLSAVAGLKPTKFSAYVRLLYRRLDSTGGALGHGSYAFLSDPSDLRSGATTYTEVSQSSALLLNVFGDRSTSYFDFLATLKLGDRVTWFPGGECWYHFRVTAIYPDPSPPARKLVGIANETERACSVDPAWFHSRRGRLAGLDWHRIPPSEPPVGPDGIRYLLHRYPVEGGHTYRLTAFGQPTSYVIDVPEGIRLIELGGAIPSDGHFLISYKDEISGVVLALDPFAGYVSGYDKMTDRTLQTIPTDLVAKFEAIIASFREIPLP